MRHLLALALVTFALTGCQSAVVGQWIASDLPDVMSSEMDRVVLDIDSDGTILATMELDDGSTQGGATGQWKRLSDTQVRFVAKFYWQGYSESIEATGHLRDDDTMVAMVDPGITVGFARSKQEPPDSTTADARSQDRTPPQ